MRRARSAANLLAAIGGRVVAPGRDSATLAPPPTVRDSFSWVRIAFPAAQRAAGTDQKAADNRTTAWAGTAGGAVEVGRGEA